MTSGFSYPPLPPIDESEIRPPKIRYLYASLAMVLGFILGMALTIWSGITSDNNPDAILPTFGVMVGMGLITVGMLGGKIWLILLAVQRSSHRKKLQMERRAEQMGWVVSQ